MAHVGSWQFGCGVVLVAASARPGFALQPGFAPSSCHVARGFRGAAAAPSGAPRRARSLQQLQQLPRQRCPRKAASDDEEDGPSTPLSLLAQGPAIPALQIECVPWLSIFSLGLLTLIDGHSPSLFGGVGTVLTLLACASEAPPWTALLATLVVASAANGIDPGQAFLCLTLAGACCPHEQHMTTTPPQHRHSCHDSITTRSRSITTPP